MSSLEQEAQELEKRITAQLGSGPLVAVGERLLSFLNGVGHAVVAGHPESMLRDSLRFVRSTLRGLPTSFDERFLLDAEIIQTILSEWSSGEVAFSRLVVPRYTGEWGYYRLMLPSENATVAHVMGIVTFLGADRASDVDLADYAWLLHELAHDCLYRVQDRFRGTVDRRVQERSRQLQLRAAADTGAARHRAAEHVTQLSQYWTPTPNQVDWSHEVACDVIALYVLGPAYASALRRVVSDLPSIDEVTMQHPSYRTRAHALMITAEVLGWSDDAWGLRELGKSMPPAEGATSLVYADADLLRGVVDASLSICRTALPCMTPGRLASLIEEGHAVAPPRGVDLIALASYQRNRLPPAQYRAWHHEVLGRLA